MREGKVEAGAVDVDGEDGRDAVRARDGAREEADRAGAEDDEALRPLRRGERRREACAARGVDEHGERLRERGLLEGDVVGQSMCDDMS